MAKYFKPETPANGRNYQIVRRRKNGQLVRDQLPFEGIYTEYEMSRIVDASHIKGEWIELNRRQVGFIFGLRQQIG